MLGGSGGANVGEQQAMAGGTVKSRNSAEHRSVQGMQRSLAAGIWQIVKSLELGKRARHLTELLAVGVLYFVLAKVGFALASLNPVSPIWPPTGFALAAIVLRGYRIWPAIFLGALIANEAS